MSVIRAIATLVDADVHGKSREPLARLNDAATRLALMVSESTQAAQTASVLEYARRP